MCLSKYYKNISCVYIQWNNTSNNTLNLQRSLDINIAPTFLYFYGSVEIHEKLQSFRIIV